MVGKIKRVKLRAVWKHEAADFTTWMEENIDVLNDALNLTLVSADREQSAGTFSVDLVAEDSSGDVVVIENQLGKSDHDHLGKLLTYLTAMEAKAAVWVVSEPRPEHVKAIAWLNESSSAAFFLVKIEAIQIDNSAPAPLLTLITGPSPEAVQTGEKKKELAARHGIRREFWTQLLELAKQKTKLHGSISPGSQSFVGSTADLPSGLYLNYVVRRHEGQVELYIDVDQDTGEGNTQLLKTLLTRKDEIENDFGEPLAWETLEGKRACRVKKVVSGGGWQDEEAWPKVQAEMIDAMIRLDKALRPYLKKTQMK